MNRITLGLGLAALLVASGCGGGTACKTDADCASGFTCDVASGKCNAKGTGATTGTTSTTGSTSSTSTTGTHGSSSASGATTSSAASGSSGTSSTVGSSGTASSAGGTTGSSTGSAAVLVVNQGGLQSAFVDQQLQAPLVVQLTNNGAAVAGALLTASAPAGAVVTPSTATTDGQGKASFVLELGRATGTQTFHVAGGGASVDVSQTATAPAAGTVFTLVDASHAVGTAPASAGPATAAITRANSVAVAADGTLYVGDASQAIYAIDPSGQLTVLASNTGQISGLALDRAHGRLYFSEVTGNTVRVITLSSKVIDLFAGSGTAYNRGGLATAAQIGVAAGVRLGPDGRVYIVDAGFGTIRVVDPATGIISDFVTSASCGAGFCYTGHTANGRGDIAWDALGQAFLFDVFTMANRPPHAAVVRRAVDGTLTMVSGYAGFTGNATVTDGLAIGGWAPDSPGRLAMDPAGNLFLALDGQVVFRADAQSGRLTRVAGTGASGADGDFGPATAATFTSVVDLVIDDQLNLELADVGAGAVRTVWGAGQAQPTPAILSLVSGDGQTTLVDATPPQPIKLKVQQGNWTLQGYPVSLSPITEGAAVFAPTFFTDASNTVLALVRPGLFVGANIFKVSALDLHGQNIVGSPLTFTVNASAPDAGTIFTAVDAIGAGFSSDASTGPAVLAQTGPLQAVVTASDGTAYISLVPYNPGCTCSGNPQVFKMSPLGELTHVAGGPNCTGTSNTAASTGCLSGVRSMALDEANQRLYVAGTATGQIQRIDLANDRLDVVAGGGNTGAPSYGDNGAPTQAQLFGVRGMTLGPDHNLYFIDAAPVGNGSGVIREIDFGANLIRRVYTPPNAGCPNSNAANTIASQMKGIAVDGFGAVYFAAMGCGSSSGSFFTVMPGGAPSAWGTMSGDNQYCVENMVILASGAIFFTERCTEQLQWLQPGGGQAYPIAGVLKTAGNAQDYAFAGSQPFDYPSGLAVTPAHHFLITDHNAGLKLIW